MIQNRNHTSLTQWSTNPQSEYSHLLRQAVRHSNAVLTYAPMYWPKEGICAGYIDQYQISQGPVCVALYKGCSTASRLCFPFDGCPVCSLRSPNQTSQLLFRLLISMDLFMSNRCAHLKIFATRSTCLQKRARCFLCTVYRDGINPAVVLAQ